MFLAPNRDEPIDEIEETYEELGAVGSHEQMEGKEGEYGNNVDEWVNCSGAPVPLMQSTACDLDYVLTNEEQQQSTALSLEKQKQNKVCYSHIFDRINFMVQFLMLGILLAHSCN